MHFLEYIQIRNLICSNNFDHAQRQLWMDASKEWTCKLNEHQQQDNTWTEIKLRIHKKKGPLYILYVHYMRWDTQCLKICLKIIGNQTIAWSLLSSKDQDAAYFMATDVMQEWVQGRRRQELLGRVLEPLTSTFTIGATIAPWYQCGDTPHHVKGTSLVYLNAKF